MSWADSEDSASQQLAMYIFEKQAECHLSDEQLKKYGASFHTIFEKGLQAADMKVRVAALLATTSFLLSVTDEAILATFQGLMP